MMDMFANIFSDLKGSYDSTSGFFDESMASLGSGEDGSLVAGEGSGGGFDLGNLVDSALLAFSPTDKESQNISINEGQVSQRGDVRAGSTEPTKSVNMNAIQQQWLVRLRQYSKVDGA